ncbi:MAG TPA: M14 family zinc carboxypeptidase [Flavobacteriaceae bacterium]|nr:M14 family zinc carboxypeptidase [Flavobacteriaceae bacterium]
MNRYIPFEKLEKTLLELPFFFKVEDHGKSVDGKSIYSVQFGNGKTKILMWSQMHGNETTTTKAVLDLFRAFSQPEIAPMFQDIIENCTIQVIPVLNPDGAMAYSRENKNKIDLNRDAVLLSQPESQILHSIFENYRPDFCFNLHDQRSIYGVGTTEKPAVVSFLAPSVNKGRTLTEPRKTAMKLIAEMNSFLQTFIPGNVGRYDDFFNPNCVGDKFQSMEIPTVLVEAGHFPNDYDRNTTRKLVFLAISKALFSVASKSFTQQNFKNYFNIPENEKSFFDIILRNVNINGEVADLAIQFEEQLKDQEIEFVPVTEKIGNLSLYFGHKNLDFHGEKLRINRSIAIEEKIEIKHIAIGNEEISSILTNN